MKAICGKCQLEMKTARIGVLVETMTTIGPYQLFAADALECASCHFRIVMRFAATPIAEHFDADYAQTRARLASVQPILQCWANPKEKAEYYENRRVALHGH